LKKFNNETNAFTEPLPCLFPQVQSNPLDYRICQVCQMIGLNHYLHGVFDQLMKIGAEVVKQVE